MGNEITAWFCNHGDDLSCKIGRLMSDSLFKESNSSSLNTNNC